MLVSSTAESFLAENHLCTFTTVRPDGSPHVAPVRFTWDREARKVRIMSTRTRKKTRNVFASPSGRVAVCQSDGPRWITLEGVATVHDDPVRVKEGTLLYTRRYYSVPPSPPELVVIEIEVDRVMGLY